jgi:hypothetical protein
MPQDWAVFDSLLHELGAVSKEACTLAGLDEAKTPQGQEVVAAVDRAAQAVHHCLDDAAEGAVLDAWTAIRQAQDTLRRMEALLARARQTRQEAQDIRRRAAIQREAAKRWRRAGAMGLLGDAPGASDSAWNGPLHEDDEEEREDREPTEED